MNPKFFNDIIDYHIKSCKKIQKGNYKQLFFHVDSVIFLSFYLSSHDNNEKRKQICIETTHFYSEEKKKMITWLQLNNIEFEPKGYDTPLEWFYNLYNYHCSKLKDDYKTNFRISYWLLKNIVLLETNEERIKTNKIEIDRYEAQIEILERELANTNEKCENETK